MNTRLLLRVSKQISSLQWCGERCNYFLFSCVRKHHQRREFPLPHHSRPRPSPRTGDGQRSDLMPKHGSGASAPSSLPVMRTTNWDQRNDCLPKPGKEWQEAIWPTRSIESEWYSQAYCSPSQRIKFPCVSSEMGWVCNIPAPHKCRLADTPESWCVWLGGALSCVLSITLIHLARANTLSQGAA